MMKMETANQELLAGALKAQERKTVFECHMHEEKTVRMTGKKYKKWSFIGWSFLPNLELCKVKRKGEWLIVDEPCGRYRYNIGEEAFTNGVANRGWGEL